MKQVRNLAVLKYIQQAIPTADSWHPYGPRPVYSHRRRSRDVRY